MLAESVANAMSKNTEDVVERGKQVLRDNAIFLTVELSLVDSPLYLFGSMV